MKTKHIFLLASVFSLFVGLFNESVFAYTLQCEEVSMYCNYQGLFKDIDNADEEFMMLMESPRHSNFKDMFTALLYIVGCSEESKACMKALKDPNCKISEYTKKLVSFYEDNVSKIEDEDVIQLFDTLKKGEGREFFNKEAASK